VFLSAGNVNTNSGACGAGTASNTNTHDAQRRLTQVTNSAGGVTTYTAWDSSGRPTTGSTNGISIANVYDDAARTITQTQVPPAGTRSVSTQTFDADGAQVRVVVVEGNVTTTTTFANTATAKVCK
jgi:YD repeat-containing protein